MKVVKGELSTIHLAAMLWMDMVKESRPDWEPNVKWWIDTATRNMAAGHYQQLMVLTDDGELVGFGDFFMFPEPSTGRLHCTGQHLYVRPEFRGSTAAMRLVRAWYRAAKDAGASVVEMFTFSDEQGRWKKLGFEPVRTLMRKELHNV